MWDARRRALALVKLRNSGLRHLGRQDVKVGRTTDAPGHGEVDAGRDDAVDPLRRGQPVDRVLVLHGSMARRSAKWKPGAAGSRSTATTYTPRSAAPPAARAAGTRP